MWKLHGKTFQPRNPGSISARCPTLILASLDAAPPETSLFRWGWKSQPGETIVVTSFHASFRSLSSRLVDRCRYIYICIYNLYIVQYMYTGLTLGLKSQKKNSNWKRPWFFAILTRFSKKRLGYSQLCQFRLHVIELLKVSFVQPVNHAHKNTNQKKNINSKHQLVHPKTIHSNRICLFRNSRWHLEQLLGSLGSQLICFHLQFTRVHG